MAGVLRRRGRLSPERRPEEDAQQAVEPQAAPLPSDDEPVIIEPTTFPQQETEPIEPIELDEPAEVEVISTDAETMARLQAHEYGIPFVDLTRYDLTEDMVKLVPANTLKAHVVLPLALKGNELTIAISDAENVVGLDEIKHATEFKYVIRPMIAVASEIQKALDIFLGHADAIEMDGKVQDVVHEADEQYAMATEVSVTDAADLEVNESAPIVVRIVNLILVTAIKKGASDIHIQPEENAIRVRYRVDGVLQDCQPHSWRYGRALAARLKVMAKLDIAEKRRPQDGGISFKADGKRYDLRVSTLPSVYGEKVVMRIAEESGHQVGLDELGFSPDQLVRFSSIVDRPYGMILVTGPTGSGKTTTLYSVLSHLNMPEKNIVTVEDPVERRLRGICQTQVGSTKRSAVTFATALRAILRQDPDVIMVGEIRDHDTAEIATHASLTGHLVLSTLHTNDAPSAAPRLIDMGIESYLVSSSVLGVLAQRLVRVLCPKCKEGYELPVELIRSMGVPLEGMSGNVNAWRPQGCTACDGQGYKGRLGVFELVIMTEEMRRLIVAQAPASEIAVLARSQGMTTMLEDAVAKVLEGTTSIQEALRVVDRGDSADITEEDLAGTSERSQALG